MKAVILAAGKSTRTYPLTLTRPKCLLQVANTTILQHTLDQLQGIADEAIVVVGYKKEMITSQFPAKQGAVKITFIEQKEQNGTGHALLQARHLLGGEEQFLVLNGDDLFFHDDIAKLIKAGKQRAAALAKQHPHPERFGVYSLDKHQKLPVSFIEKPAKPRSGLSGSGGSGLVNIGCYLFPATIFDIRLAPSPRGEIEVTDFVKHLIAHNAFAVVEAKQWHPITYPWDLLEANAALLSQLQTAGKQKTEKKGCTIEKNATIKGPVRIGKGTVIRAGSYIEGPVVIGEGCMIGPNCYLRPSSSIGNNCKIGHEVEIKNSIIGDGSAVPHLSYIGDSVIGNNVNVGAGSITANVRHDKGLIRSSVLSSLLPAEKGEREMGECEISEREMRALKGELVNTGLAKLGVIIGDGAMLGIRTLIYPGRKIWPGMTTLPGEIVRRDIDGTEK
ncbi:NTP transferase domain-containing protein [Candidatus Woesearchaeota archaeon]|nr:NTP transferase domain-containing protein [Candidatus Woesearchaeota archaeon]